MEEASLRPRNMTDAKFQKILEPLLKSGLESRVLPLVIEWANEVYNMLTVVSKESGQPAFRTSSKALLQRIEEIASYVSAFQLAPTVTPRSSVSVVHQASVSFPSRSPDSRLWKSSKSCQEVVTKANENDNFRQSMNPRPSASYRPSDTLQSPGRNRSFTVGRDSESDGSQTPSPDRRITFSSLRPARRRKARVSRSESPNRDQEVVGTSLSATSVKSQGAKERPALIDGQGANSARHFFQTLCRTGDSTDSPTKWQSNPRKPPPFLPARPTSGNNPRRRSSCSSAIDSIGPGWNQPPEPKLTVSAPNSGKCVKTFAPYSQTGSSTLLNGGGTPASNVSPISSCKGSGYEGSAFFPSLSEQQVDHLQQVRYRQLEEQELNPQQQQPLVDEPEQREAEKQPPIQQQQEQQQQEKRRLSRPLVSQKPGRPNPNLPKQTPPPPPPANFKVVTGERSNGEDSLAGKQDKKEHLWGWSRPRKSSESERRASNEFSGLPMQTGLSFKLDMYSQGQESKPSNESSTLYNKIGSTIANRMGRRSPPPSMIELQSIAALVNQTCVSQDAEQKAEPVEATAESEEEYEADSIYEDMALPGSRPCPESNCQSPVNESGGDAPGDTFSPRILNIKLGSPDWSKGVLSPTALMDSDCESLAGSIASNSPAISMISVRDQFKPTSPMGSISEEFRTRSPMGIPESQAPHVLPQPEPESDASEDVYVEMKAVLPRLSETRVAREPQRSPSEYSGTLSDQRGGSFSTQMSDCDTSGSFSHNPPCTTRSSLLSENGDDFGDKLPPVNMIGARGLRGHFQQGSLPPELDSGDIDEDDEDIYQEMMANRVRSRKLCRRLRHHRDTRLVIADDRVEETMLDEKEVSMIYESNSLLYGVLHKRTQAKQWPARYCRLETYRISYSSKPLPKPAEINVIPLFGYRIAHDPRAHPWAFSLTHPTKRMYVFRGADEDDFSHWFVRIEQVLTACQKFTSWARRNTLTQKPSPDLESDADSFTEEPGPC